MADLSRRAFVGGTAGSVAAASLLPGGIRSAESASVTYQALTEAQAATLSAWCDALVPGAEEAGVAAFVDAQLAAPLRDTMLVAKYLTNPPRLPLYRGGLAGIDAESHALHGAAFTALAADARESVIEAAAAGKTAAWTDPDPAFFTFLTRSDGIDVLYGTVAGFERLGIDYLAHIGPPEPW